ncbi:DUF3348 family protein [Rubrivivax albus]|uniref:DUF3348 family protein n=1 Tax=Rubrivivax albus TaxID=2499835 RepID=UPI0013050B9F|nr:DUF3348 family protein [Rubrivivax albus]
MTTAATLHQPPLVRQLLALGLAEPGADDARPAAGPGPSVAERLAPWLAWTDAIALAGALDAAAPAPGTPAQAATARRQAETARATVQRQLAEAIDRDLPAGLAADDLPADASPGRRYRAHQQAMDRRIAPLRAQARRALALQSAALGRIAVLDGLLEQALAARERQLLSALPAWLDRRLQREPAPPQAVTMPLLHAELAHRLQPVDGMLAALQGAAAQEPTP